MIHVFLGKNVEHNVRLIKELERFEVDYTLFAYSDIDQPVLDFLMLHSKDCFEFLADRLKPYQVRTDVSYSELCQEVLADTGRNIKFPLVVKDDQVYAGLSTLEMISLIFPKRVRLLLRRHYLIKSTSMYRRVS